MKEERNIENYRTPQIRLDPEMAQFVVDKAEAEHRTIASVIRQAIADMMISAIQNQVNKIGGVKG